MYGHANECLSGCNALPGPDMLQVSLMQMPAPVPWGTTSTTGLPPPAITEVTGNGISIHVADLLVLVSI